MYIHKISVYLSVCCDSFSNYTTDIFIYLLYKKNHNSVWYLNKLVLEDSYIHFRLYLNLFCPLLYLRDMYMVPIFIPFSYIDISISSMMKYLVWKEITKNEQNQKRIKLFEILFVKKIFADFQDYENYRNRFIL